MKKIVVVLILLMLLSPCAFAFGKKKKNTDAQEGYYGRIPQINAEFDDDRTNKKDTIEANPPIILNDKSFDIEEKDLKSAPLDNSKYVDIIIKQDKASTYANDINELVPILKKLRECIEQEQDIQKFNAIVSNYIDNVQYIEKKYKHSPEFYYVSFEKISDAAKYMKKVAITRTEALTVNKYVSYEEGNGVYSPENIKSLLENTLVEIEETLDAIKEAK